MTLMLLAEDLPAGHCRQRYRTILADPPWKESGGGKCKRGADRHYDLMSTKEICALRPAVQDLADPAGCHLWLWVTGNFLEDGFTVLGAWGFRYVNFRPWIKGEEADSGEIELQNAGMGQYMRCDSEILLFAVRGPTLPYKHHPDGKRAQCRQSLIAPRSPKHSEKPEQLYRDIELVSHGPYLEMFCRSARPGWHSWGNEVEGDVRLRPATEQLQLLGGS